MNKNIYLLNSSLKVIYRALHCVSFCLQDIYLHDPDVRWNDIIGLDAAKRLVKEAVVYPIKVSLPHSSKYSTIGAWF